jgi:hypothetical protein
LIDHIVVFDERHLRHVAASLTGGSRPGKPTDNAFCEAFNGRVRAECLNLSHYSGKEVPSVLNFNKFLTQQPPLLASNCRNSCPNREINLTCDGTGIVCAVDRPLVR